VSPEKGRECRLRMSPLIETTRPSAEFSVKSKMSSSSRLMADTAAREFKGGMEVVRECTGEETHSERSRLVRHQKDRR